MAIVPPLNSWDDGYKEFFNFVLFLILVHVLKQKHVCCRAFRKHRKDSFLLKDCFRHNKECHGPVHPYTLTRINGCSFCIIVYLRFALLEIPVGLPCLQFMKNSTGSWKAMALASGSPFYERIKQWLDLLRTSSLGRASRVLEK